MINMLIDMLNSFPARIKNDNCLPAPAFLIIFTKFALPPEYFVA